MDLIILPSLDEPVASVLPDGFQEPVPRLARDLAVEDQAFVNQRSEHVEDLPLLDTIAGANGFRAIEPPASLEHGEPLEQLLFAVAQQVVRPVDKCSQSLLPGQ